MKKIVANHSILTDSLGILIKELQGRPFSYGCLILTRSRTLGDSFCGTTIPQIGGSMRHRSKWTGAVYQLFTRHFIVANHPIHDSTQSP